MTKIDEIKARYDKPYLNMISKETIFQMLDELRPYLIEWHKYPDEYPKNGRYLVFNEEGINQYYTADFSNGDFNEMFDIRPDYWAEIPKPEGI